MLKNSFHPNVFIIMALLVIAMLVVPQALAVTFTVNSTDDLSDDLTIPGTCHTAVNTCTLRAAVMQANRTSGLGATIIVPAGIYKLTIPAARDWAARKMAT
jgi:large repetitive protein